MSAAPRSAEPAAEMPAITIAIPASASEADLGGTLASLNLSAGRSGRSYELLVAINGPERPSPALASVRVFAATAGLPLTISGDDVESAAPDAHLDGETIVGAAIEDGRDGAVLPAIRVLRLAARSKIVAWNAIRDAAGTALIVFADADVRVSADAIALLAARLEAEPDLAAVAGREVAVVGRTDGFVTRVGALPYRFDFANIPGRLYAVRTAAMPSAIPADVIAEDGYLTVQLGRDRFTREPRAVVYLRPPGTWTEYLTQRVRHELGKIQLVREFAEPRRAHGFGRSPWRAFARDIRVGEYPLVAASLAVRGVAHARAWWQARRGFAAGWPVLSTTKRWPQAAGDGRGDSTASGAPQRSRAGG